MKEVRPTYLLDEWFKQRFGGLPFAFQKECWEKYLSGHSGLVHASTGTGKTYSVWPGPLLEYMGAQSKTDPGKYLPLTVLWITPLRALASDIAESLLAPVADLHLPFSVETRTADTSASRRARQKEKLPSCLVTTPESVSILLSYPQPERFQSLKLVVVDEWHELLGSKRGVQTELALARLRKLAPGLRVWVLPPSTISITSSTIGKPV